MAEQKQAEAAGRQAGEQRRQVEAPVRTPAEDPTEGQAREAAPASLPRSAETAPPPGPAVDPAVALATIAESLGRLAGGAEKTRVAAPAKPDRRPGGLFRVGERLVNSNNQEIRGAKEGDGGRLYGGDLYDPRTNQVVRTFADDEENVG